MNQSSIVYGCIKDTVLNNTNDQSEQHRRINQLVMKSLPSIEDFPLLSREMFSQTANDKSSSTHIVHFGISYYGIEYEWETWIKEFETLLNDMYWVSATVHLETEFNGVHTFTWEADNDFHEPNSGDFSCRCEWTREAAFG